MQPAFSPVHTVTLDCVRAISALIVFGSHIIQIFWLPKVGLGSALHLTNSVISECAVIVFFILSGYLISLSISNNVRKKTRFSVFDYARSRLLRIYPPFLFAVAISILIYSLLNYFSLPGVSTPLRHPSDIYSARDLLTFNGENLLTALALSGGLDILNGPLWSLYIEAHIYGAAGVVAFILYGASPALWRIVTGGSVLITILILGVKAQPYFLLYTCWWAIGALFFLWRLRGGSKFELAFVSLVIAAIIIVLSDRPVAIEIPRFGLLWLLSYFMFFRLKLEIQLFRKMASYSYTLYLLHFPICLLFYSLFLSLHYSSAPSFLDRVALTAISLIGILYVSRVVGEIAENGRLLTDGFAAVMRRFRERYQA